MVNKVIIPVNLIVMKMSLTTSIMMVMIWTQIEVDTRNKLLSRGCGCVGCRGVGGGRSVWGWGVCRGIDVGLTNAQVHTSNEEVVLCTQTRREGGGAPVEGRRSKISELWEKRTKMITYNAEHNWVKLMSFWESPYNPIFSEVRTFLLFNTLKKRVRVGTFRVSVWCRLEP